MVGALGGVGTTAAAQPGAGGPGGPIGPGGAPPGGGGRKEKKEGPAEEAPKDKEALRPIEPVPATPRRLRRLELFDLNGYMRMRGDYFHRLGLGLLEPATLEDGDRPQRFFDPPAESQETDEDGNIIGTNDASCLNRLLDGGVSAARAVTRCNRRQGFASANMRLRLEPSLHITDTVHVHTQVDILDNVVLGSTPDSLLGSDPYAPLDLYTRSQDPPASGVTGTKDSVVVKRAWGDIRFGWGLQVEFGRMPWSWGMGMVANGGNGYSKLAKDDIIQQLDRDHGDSVDSVRLGFDFGKDRRKTHKLRLSWDWANSGPTTAQLLGPEYGEGGTIGQAFSAEKFDNVYQWAASIERRDEPEMLKRKLSLGNPVFNYGVIGWLRYQDLDDAYGSASVEDVSDFQTYTNSLVQRRALMVTPDAWMRVNWRTLRVELEAAATFGRFQIRDFDSDLDDGQNSLNELNSDGLNRKSILNFGYALEFKYGFFDDRFHIGFDHGFATGDTASPLDSDPASPLNQNDNSRFSQFRFNPAYNTDLLLFRELLGTVSNAAYFKPWAAFYFFDHFSARADIEYAMAVERQSTLGNRFSYGVELDGAARYHDAREPIFFQIQYGVLFPLGAFNRNLANGGREDARAVQTLQAQVGIKF
ncbi:MAG: TIGR04551 family protein [Nannocystales bacterium]